MKEELLELKKHLEASPTNVLDFEIGDRVQLTVLENFKFPGNKLFVRDDGKVGFPTINSIPFEVGDTVRGVVRRNSDTYFFVEVQEVI